MTQEEKQLLLKDLCARLPYGVKVKYIFEDGSHCPFELSTKILQECLDKSFKSYLRPMSSMTEDEVKQYYKIRTGEDRNKPLGELDAELFDFYHKNHIDYRGLIPMGLALEAPEDMYKTE